MDAIFFILVLVMSIVVHEVAHGFMAERLGDNTARYAGRLTINPLKHLDPFGSVLLPALLVLLRTPFLFGWAKPVPYNPDNLSNRRWGSLAVAAAGVLTNIMIAILFGIVMRFSYGYDLPVGFYEITSLIVQVNLGLALFNLVPIPPLDGSKILYAFLPQSLYPFFDILEQYAFVFLLLFIAFFSDLLVPILRASYTLLTGLAF